MTSASDILAQSTLKPFSQLEGMGADVDVLSFQLMMRDKAGISLSDAISSATLSRTIEGASTLTVTVEDDLTRTIQRSGRLGRKVDVNIDGLYFTLVQVKKNQRQLTLVFEDREVNALRYYDTFIQADRSKITRAEFVLRMIREVKEVHLKWVIPELSKVQRVSDIGLNQVLVDAAGTPLVNKLVDKATSNLIDRSRAGGILSFVSLTVRGAFMDQEQATNANTIIDVGLAMGANYKVIVSSIMTAIDESNIKNLTGGDLDSVGVFQQRASQGWPATRNVATDAAAYFQRAIANDKSNPSLSLNDLCQGVQHSGTPNAYGQFQQEATDIVNAYGVKASDASIAAAAGVSTVAKNTNITATPNDSSLSPFFFTRGTLATDSAGETLLTKENSWACIQRLASEVNWRAFCVSGVIYFISDEDLFLSKPFMTISEDSDGIDWIDYDFDEGKKRATLSITAHLSRWSAPPGSTIEVINMGSIANGKWIVDTVERSLFDPTATITAVKPQPVLPEPTASGTSNVLNGTANAILPTPAFPAAAIASGSGETVGPVQAKIISYARSQLGVPYQYGAEAPGVAFDCSGLAQAAYSAAGISIPRTSQAQFAAGPVVLPPATLQPGDLVYFIGKGDNGTATAPGHVGIYIGSGQFIDAPFTGASVRIDTLDTGGGDYVGATRSWQK